MCHDAKEAVAGLMSIKSMGIASLHDGYPKRMRIIVN